MQHPSLPSPSIVRLPSRARQLTFLALGICLAALLAALAVVLIQVNFASATGPFSPTAEDGLIPEGTTAALAADDVPAIGRLDPALLAAMREAETDAVADGVPAFEVTSGWRSERYQQWLLDDAVGQYGSEEVARQFVATPDRSQHVTGDAVDIAPIDAQFWLIQYGSQYGICQTYANERWHFELATEPGGVCPEMKTDAAS